MNSHADTIRDYIKNSTPDWSTPIPFPAAEAWDAVTALLAENQRLRDALEAERAQRKWAFEQLRMWWRGVHRDGDSAAAIEELYRVEKALR